MFYNSALWLGEHASRKRRIRNTHHEIRNTQYAIHNTQYAMRIVNVLQNSFRFHLAEFTSQLQHAVCSGCCYLDDGAGCELSRVRICLTRNTQTVPSSLNSLRNLLIMSAPPLVGVVFSSVSTFKRSSLLSCTKDPGFHNTFSDITRSINFRTQPKTKDHRRLRQSIQFSHISQNVRHSIWRLQAVSL